MSVLTHLFALALVLGASPALGAEPEVEGAKARVDGAVQAWEASVHQQSGTRSRYEALEHRISELKKASAGRSFSGSSELDKLLKESVGAGEALRADDQSVASSAGRVTARVQEAIALVDARIKALAPAMKQGPLDSRKRAAHEITELTDLRRELKQIAGKVEGAALPKAWSRYEVKVDPLDGPSELQEKADLLDDQSDKFRKKREELTRLIQEAKEEQTIAKAGAEFRTDARHFDEEARLGRITRQSDKTSGGAAAPTSLADTTGSRTTNKTADVPTQQPAPSTAGAGAQAPSQSTAPGATDSSHASAPPATPSSPAPGTRSTSGSGGENDAFSTNPANSSIPQSSAAASATDRANPNSTTGVSAPSSGAFPQAPIAKAVDPSVLLNLRIDALGAGGVDLRTLERYEKDLDELERFLSKRAKELRKKAAEMKASGQK
jgi:hypothetical protein